MQSPERNIQIHPASFLASVQTMNPTKNPNRLREIYSRQMGSYYDDFDMQLVHLIEKEDLIVKIILLCKYIFERKVIDNAYKNHDWEDQINNAYEMGTSQFEEFPDIIPFTKILGVNKKTDLIRIRILVERIYLDYHLHLSIINLNASILHSLKEENEAIQSANETQLSRYILEYRQMRSDFGGLEQEIKSYNELEIKLDELEQDFLAQAGPYEANLQELSIAEMKLEWKISYRQIHPESSDDEMEAAMVTAMQKMQDELDKLSELKRKIDEAQLQKAYEKDFLNASYRSDEDSQARSDRYLRKLKSESRKELKKTIKMAHPDILNNHEQYGSLSVDQKSEIETLLNEELETLEKIDKLSSKMSSEYFMQLINKTKEARKKIDRILRFSGIPVNPDFIIEGNNIELRINDIGKRIKKIGLRIFEWKRKAMGLPYDDEKRRRVNIIKSQKLQEYISRLKESIVEVDKRIKEYEQKLSELSNK